MSVDIIMRKYKIGVRSINNQSGEKYIAVNFMNEQPRLIHAVMVLFSINHTEMNPTQTQCF